MKCAFGENPKRCYRDKCDLHPHVHGGARCASALMQARDYGARKQAANGDVTKMPALRHEARGAAAGAGAARCPLKAHAHQANDLFTALRIAREFDRAPDAGARAPRGISLRTELAKAKDVPHGCRPEPDATPASSSCSNKILGNARRAGRRGLPRVHHHRFDSVIPQQYLPLCAGIGGQGAAWTRSTR